MDDTWQFNPVGSSLQNPQHVYTHAGTYPVALQVYNADGYTSTRMAGYITAAPGAPTVTGITPSTGANPTTASIMNLAVTNFATGATVRQNRTCYGDITGSVSGVTPTKIVCTFNLVGKATGLRNVTVPGAAFAGTPSQGTAHMTVTSTDASTGRPNV